MPELCPCVACKDWRTEPGQGEHVCFYIEGPGHGPCVDPHRIGCVCIGTAADGECEACWLWLK